MHEPRLSLVGGGHHSVWMDKSDWAAEVSAWRRSGQTGPAYCGERGLKLTRLRYWTSKLKRQKKGALSHQVEAASGSRLAQVRVRQTRTRAPSTLAQGEAAAFRLVVGEVLVDVPKSFDAEALAQLLDVLEGGRR